MYFDFEELIQIIQISDLSDQKGYTKCSISNSDNDKHEHVSHVRKRKFDGNEGCQIEEGFQYGFYGIGDGPLPPFS